MAPDEKLEIEAEFRDAYSEGAASATKETQKLSGEMDTLQASTVDANVAFLAQQQALEGVSAGYNQMLAGATDLGILEGELREKFIKVKGALDLTIGSMRLYSVWSEISTKLTDRQSLALKNLALAGIGLIGIYGALNAESDQMRAVFSILTGATLTLAAAKSISAIAAAAEVSALTLGVGIAAVIAGVTFFGSKFAAAKAEADQGIPQAQTGPGQTRRATRSGQAFLHEGEEVSRPAEVTDPMSMGPTGGRPGVIVNLIGVNDLGNRPGAQSMADRISPFLNIGENRRASTLRMGV